MRNAEWQRNVVAPLVIVVPPTLKFDPLDAPMMPSEFDAAPLPFKLNVAAPEELPSVAVVAVPPVPP